jgi:hypothetical protein
MESLMTILIVDGPHDSGVDALVEYFLERIPYAKSRQFSGKEPAREYQQAIDADKAANSLFPLITVWQRSWVSGWVFGGLSTRDADRFDEQLKDLKGFGLILTGDDEEVDEDQQELFADYALGEMNDLWTIIEEPTEGTKIYNQIKDRIKI